MPELAQSIPTAKLDEHTHITGQVARVNLERAKVSSKVRLHVGPAADTLRNMHPEQLFDLAFIDADKPSILTYFLEAKRLVRKGGVVVSKFPTFYQNVVAECSTSQQIVDNVVRRGDVADPNCVDEKSEGVRKLLRYLQTDEDVDATTITTVGEKGYDGILYALLKE